MNVICGSGWHAAEAAVKKAEELGYAPLLLTTTLTGDALGAASMYAAIVREVLASGNPVPSPCAIVSGGEATVTVRGGGDGGPNQEFVLALAVELDGVEGWAAFSADTDGHDGSTEAAGGIVDGRRRERIREPTWTRRRRWRTTIPFRRWKLAEPCLSQGRRAPTSTTCGWH